MTFTSPHIGQRIRAFRQLKGFTQQQLELELEASFGHLSKIESGKVNPTKETITSIAKLLGLNENEKMILLGFTLNQVIPKEADKAIKITANHFDSCPNPMILVDDFWFVWRANNIMLDFMGVPNDPLNRSSFYEKFHNVNILEWLSNPALVLRPSIPNDKWEEILLGQCIYFINYVNYPIRKDQSWLKDLLSKLSQLEGFKKVWRQALEVAFSQEYSGKRCAISFLQPGKYQEYFIANTLVDKMPRFRVIEYIPKD